MTLHLGLDLGGSALKGVVLDADFAELWFGVVDTEADADPRGIVAQLGVFGNEIAAEVGPLATAGVTIPGLFDHATGVAEFVTNLGGTSWSGVPVVAPLREALGVPVALINDARAFGFAEARLGAARGCDTAAFFTLGTGIGGSVVVRGQLHLGLGQAGELGHQTVDPSPDAPVCGCGNRGCLEPHAQASRIAELGGRPTAAEVVEAARGGDERALAALETAGRWLGIGIGNAIVALNPDKVVVGGGIAEAGDLILEPARDEVRRRVRIAPVDRIPIVKAELGYDAGAVGAAVWGAERA